MKGVFIEVFLCASAPLREIKSVFPQSTQRRREKQNQTEHSNNSIEDVISVCYDKSES